MIGKLSSIKEPLLSICIPTYNQPEAFSRILESLLPQLTSDIEIVVRDDSTNDETKKIVSHYINSVSIRYFSGKKEGLDVAVAFLVKEAKGKFVWWFGNEVFTPGGVIKVVGTLKKYPNIDFLYVNSASINGGISINLGVSRFFKDKNEVIEKLADLLGFISAVIFKRTDALSGIEGSNKFIGSAWVNLYLVLHSIAASRHPYFLSDVCFLSDPKDPEEKLWYDRFQVFAVNFPMVVHKFDGEFDRNSIRAMLSKNFKSVWKGILVHRARNYKSSLGSSAPKIWPIAKFYWNFPDFWLALPFLIMPRFALIFFYGLWKR